MLPLVRDGHIDSAIRKAFIVLTERMRRAFGIDEQLDGTALVNAVFGKGGRMPVALEDGKKQSYRDLFCGFYGVYRNKYAHNDVEPTLTEANAVFEMVNNMLREIELIAAESVEAQAN